MKEKKLEVKLTKMIPGGFHDLEIRLEGDINEEYPNARMADYSSAVAVFHKLMQPYQDYTISPLAPETHHGDMKNIRLSLQAYADIHNKCISTK